MRKLVYVSTVLLVLGSCITPKVHNALIAESEITKKSLKKQEKKVIGLTQELEQRFAEITTLKEQMTVLRNDSLQNGKSLVALQSKYDVTALTIIPHHAIQVLCITE